MQEWLGKKERLQIKTDTQAVTDLQITVINRCCKTPNPALA